MSAELNVAKMTLKARSSGSKPMNEMLRNLEFLQNKANAYYNQIADLKRDLKRIGKDPLSINEYASYSPGGCHYWEEEELYLHQKYYAYLLYFRKLVKLVEDEIRKQKRLIKEAHREQNRRNQENHKASRSRPKDC